MMLYEVVFDALLFDWGRKMQIGAMNHPTLDPLLEIEWIGDHNFDFVDLTLEPPGADPADVDANVIRQALYRHGLGVIGHTGFLSFACLLTGIRQAALDYYLRCLEVAHAVGASILNTHYAKPSDLFSVDKKIGWHLDVLGPLCEEAAKTDITIVVEHVPQGGAD